MFRPLEMIWLQEEINDCILGLNSTLFFKAKDEMEEIVQVKEDDKLN